MRRWFRGVSHQFLDSRAFWRVRELLQRVHFSLEAGVFALKHKARNAFLRLPLFFQVVRESFPSIAISTCIVIVVLVLRRFYPMVEILSDIDPELQSTYDSFFAVIVAVTGIVLSLHFTNITTVIGSLYARMPEQIRDMLVKERAGNLYTRSLIWLTIMSIAILVLAIWLQIRSVCFALIAGITAMIWLPSFVWLTNLTFRFYDPTLFAEELRWQMTRWTQYATATARGFRWQKAPFQAHYQKQVQKLLAGLRALVSVCHEEDPLRIEPLAILAYRLIRFLVWYVPQKRAIPFESHWYRPTPQHQDWYLAQDYAVRLATQTRTELEPKEIPDQHWLEKEITSLETDSLSRCLRDGRLHVALRILGGMRLLFNALGQEWDLRYADSLLSRLSRETLNFLSGASAEESVTDVRDGTPERLALVESVGHLPIALLLGFAKDVDELERKAVLTRVDSVAWRRARAIFNLELPAVVLERLAYIQRRLLFEIKAEGRTVSPAWYIKQLALQPLAEALVACVEVLSDLPRSLYIPYAEKMIRRDSPLAAGILLSQGLEFCNKARFHFARMEGLAGQLEEAHAMDSLRWPAWQWDETGAELDHLERELVILFAKSIPQLAETNADESKPDYLGKAVHLAGEFCLDALASCDHVLWGQLFPLYSSGVIAVRERIRDKTTRWDSCQASTVVSEPLIDLCELSGYAYLFAEMHGRPELWDLCRTCWESLFREYPDIGEVVAATIAHHQSVFFITPRSTLRTQWKMRVERELRTMPRKPRSLRASGGIASILDLQQIIDHPSPLVRMMGGTRPDYLGTPYDGLDIFVDLYLKDKLAAEGIQLRWRHNLLESLRMWQEDKGSASDSQQHHEGETQ